MFSLDFSRIYNAVDVDLMNKSEVVIVGAGGSFSLASGLVRSGIQHLTVIDFDNIDCTNLVRQGYSVCDVGVPKVDALEKHLYHINPNLYYMGINKKVQDLDTDELDAVFSNVAIAFFLTDSFDAQAFGNKLALKYNIPCLFAGFYQDSRCFELFFYIPGVTPACFRCAVSPRYIAQNNAGSEILVPSNSNTIFHSMLLDSFIGIIALAILNNNTTGFVYSNWFGEYYDRNFIQFQVHPDLANEQLTSFFSPLFTASGGKNPFFNSIHQRIEPEIPPKYTLCPDCLGKGGIK